MTIFLPVFDHKWRCIELDSTNCTYRKHQIDPGASITCRGVIYCGDHIYRSARGVWEYVNKAYHEAEKYELSPADVEWRC